ncbi:MAG: transcriptional regulator [Nitrososphaerota archaeon]|nr:transcriptional regulator [Nitrososphaerota archaeon]
MISTTPSLIQLPIELFNPYRMMIMQCLKNHGNAEFRQLKNIIPEITDGNLASHLKVLEQANYIQVHKEVIDRKMRTAYEITEKGNADFENLRKRLIAFYCDRGDGHV